MPEITSVDAIRRKLQEFDEQMDGAIEAAATVARVRSDAQSLLQEITALCEKARQSLSDANAADQQLQHIGTAAAQQLQHIGQEFARLKQDGEATQAAVEDARARVIGESDSAVRLIADKLSEAEARLQKDNADTLWSQVEQSRQECERLNSEARTTQAALDSLRGRVAGELELAVQSIAEKLCEAETRLHATNMESFLQQAERMRQDFEQLNKEAGTTQAGLEEIRSRVAGDLELVVRSIAEKLLEAEERLRTSTEDSLSEQAELLKVLDESTRANAQTAELAASLADERSRQLENLLGTLRNDLHATINSERSSTEGLITSRLKSLQTQTEESVRSSMKKLQAEYERAAQMLTETATGHETLVRQEIDSFKAEMVRTLSKHRRGVRRHITEFRNEQFALVQNLTQQNDIYRGISNALSSEMATQRAHLGQFQAALNALPAQLVAVKTQVVEHVNSALRTHATEFAQKRAEQDKSVAQRLVVQDRAVQALSQRLEEIEQKLAKRSLLSRLTGGK